ncbi:uncharacterized protein LOC129582651 isoform X1 [Paramacrobiotus metropolitanus]|uniref:uncharacterized protein LOC129582651 isoform X1 n=1 Tax=Paramacrobiotus metropolitanus TaxID=2943436 RepID=UPI002445FC3E|nr:uncharacterized protein LOC129582651 isoform X1 [Paramacrobiotus metropolitanus]XP_055330195.1 uncharacterized protein LOC129582651 isoform X1 [Paramacrobiotus metropolitanus]
MFSKRTSYVNVLGDNNTLLYGRVVDVADNGLYMDLLCSGRRREFFPFHKLALSQRTERTSRDYSGMLDGESGEAVSVEVLRRDDSSGAWRWWPGKVMARQAPGPLFWRTYWVCCSVAVVQGEEDMAVTEDRPAVTWTEIFSKHRIRWPVPSTWWTMEHHNGAMVPNTTLPLRIEQGRFVKRSMPLPDDCRGASKAHLQRVMEEEKAFKGQVDCIDVMDAQLQYIVLLDDGVVLPLPEDARQEIIQPLHNVLIQRLPGILLEATAPVERRLVDESRALGADEWLHVFSNVDTMTQTGLRAVCPLWNSILDAPTLATNIIVETSVGIGNPLERQRSDYELTAPIVKFLCSSTKNIIVRSFGRIRATDTTLGEFFTVLDVIHQMAKARPGIHLNALYVVGFSNLVLDQRDGPENVTHESCTVHNPDSVDGKRIVSYGCLDDFIAAYCGLPCNTIHLVRFNMNLQYELMRYAREPMQLNVVIPRARVPLNGNCASAVWEALEATLPAPSRNELRALSKWLAEILAGNDGWHWVHRNGVCKNCRWQQCYADLVILCGFLSVVGFSRDS